MHLIHFYPRLSLVYSPEQYKHSASKSEFSSPVFREWVPHNLPSLRMMNLFISCSPLTTETFASLGPNCIFSATVFCKKPLISILFPLSVFLQLLLVVRPARQNSSRSFPGMLTFCWLFLFLAKCIWNRASVRGENKNSNVF